MHEEDCVNAFPLNEVMSGAVFAVFVELPLQ
jgi:hypothetical protein